MQRCIFVVAVATVAALFAGAAHAEPMLDKGTQELTLHGFIDFDTKDDYFVFIDLGYGYFVKTGLELGVNVGVNASDASQNYSLGPFVEYNFVTGSNMVPYLHAGARWVYADVEFGTGGKVVDNSGSELLLDGEAGVKYFLRDNIAVSTGLAYEWATDEIFDAGDDLDSGNLLLKLGMRFYL